MGVALIERLPGVFVSGCRFCSTQELHFQSPGRRQLGKLRETVAEKVISLRERALTPAASPPRRRAVQLLMFPKPKKLRGRPPKGAKTPSTDNFDIVCFAIRGIPKGRPLAQAKAEARRRVARDRNVGKAGAALFDRVLDALNHKEGKDWHSVGFYAGADQCDRPRRTVERAFEELIAYGHFLRRRVRKKRGWDISETTVPTLAKAALLGSEEEAQPEPDEEAPKATPRYRRTTRRVPTRKSKGTDEKLPGYRLFNTSGTDEKTGLILKGNLKLNIQREERNVSTRESAGDEFENIPLQESASGSDGASPAPLAVAARFDQSLPLRQRIPVWAFGRPPAASDAAAYDRMRRFAKGWDLLALREQFCEWLDTAKSNPRDGQAAFVGWLRRTAEKRPHVGRSAWSPAAQEFCFTDPKALAAAWNAEDERDQPLRAALWPCDPTRGYRPLGRLIEHVVRKLPRARA